jgi:outer membrane protein
MALSLEQAVELSRRNNPDVLTAENGRRRASATLLGANGAFLPNVNTSVGSQFREGRQQFFAGQAFGNTAGTLSSNVSADASASYSLGLVANRRAARAGIDAAQADVGASVATVRAAVTQQYINALEQDARVRLQDTLLLSARSQLELARARVAVGAATPLDARRAEVSVGQVEVARLQAANQAEVARLRLFQQLGVEPRTQVRLTTTFGLTAPPLSLEALLAQARAGSPTLNAFRARERQAQLNVGAARSQYLPSLNLQLGVSGFTNQSTDINQAIAQQQRNAALGQRQCQQQAALYGRVGLPFEVDCAAEFAFTPAQEAAIRTGNRAYPFNFTRNPYNLSAFVSLPLFNGFQREQQVQASQAAERDAEYRRRAQELSLTADVTASYRTLLTDQRAAELQQRNVQVAREALSLAEERYRVGVGTFVDVAQARGDYERAQNDYINAVYQFQRDFATLENAVGRPLR